MNELIKSDNLEKKKRNELSKKTHMMTKQKISTGTGHLGGFPDGTKWQRKT